jgi:hypothetical protein
MGMFSKISTKNSRSSKGKISIFSGTGCEQKNPGHGIATIDDIRFFALTAKNIFS